MRAWLARFWRELFKIRTRFLAVHLLLVAVPVAGIGFARFYEREMLRAHESDLIHQAEVLRQTLRLDPSGLRLEDRGALLRNIGNDTRARIRLLDGAGRVMADSDPTAAFPETGEVSADTYDAYRSGREAKPTTTVVQSRSEVRRAMAGLYGSTMRFGKDGGLLFLCSALPVLDTSGRVAGVVYVTRSTAPVWAAMHRLRQKLLQVLLLSFLVSMIISLFLAATVSRPLSRLTKVANAIAKGDRSHALHLGGRDEISQLASAFQAMTEKLDRRARDMAELTANISHEFKSPLTSLRGAAELLLEGAANDPAARARFLNNMLQDTQRLDRLVTRLLELSRVEADPAPNESLELRPLLVESVAQHGGEKVRLECSTSITRIWGRRAHLASVLGNLLDNALQHASPDSTVTLRAYDGDGPELCIAVHNMGSAISPANLGRIWDRFFTTRAESGGTGLGLPIVAAVVRAHGGRVDVASDAQSGTVFTVHLPVSGA